MEASESTTSNLGFALLGLLARRDATGYDLARRLERPIGYFWTARHSQIYPELSRLAEAGLVSFGEEPGRGPRTTKRYRITASGQSALADWVASRMEPQPVRDLEVLRLWSIWAVSNDVALGVVREVRARHIAVLGHYVDELTEVQADPNAWNSGHPMFASRITLELGVRTRTATVAWCDSVLTQWE